MVFQEGPAAVAAAVAAQRSLAGRTWPAGATVRVRMGLHTGLGVPGGDDYVGADIHRAARIAGLAAGGQTLMSEATRVLVERDLPPGGAFEAHERRFAVRPPVVLEEIVARQDTARLTREQLDPAAFEAARAAGQAMTLDEAVDYALRVVDALV